MPAVDIDHGPLEESDLRTLEKLYAGGIRSAQLVQIFRTRGFRFSEATLRKYVQKGLLPRSRRVGQKGKHQGSRGLYPVTIIRRLNTIKRLMETELTIEDIQERFLGIDNHIEILQESLKAIDGATRSHLQRAGINLSPKRVATVQSHRKKVEEHLEGLLRAVLKLEQSVSEPE